MEGWLTRGGGGGVGAALRSLGNCGGGVGRSLQRCSMLLCYSVVSDMLF